tara:strand:+ start:158 stop:661 length:504 start_codon:yes stop_codon:yes gene_type:complete
MIKKCLGLIVGLLLLTGCSEFALLSSGSSLALSNNVYAKAYSGVDLTTYLVTDKGIKTHAYEYVVKAKKLKDLVTKTIMHDFDEPIPEVLTIASVEQWAIYEPDVSIILASTKKERLMEVSDVFKICYLSFFLAVSMVILVFVLLYLLIYLLQHPIKVIKEKKKRRK